MKTGTLVKADATVVTIVSLSEGDVYKRLVKKSGDTYETTFGIVKSVMHNGEDAVVSALEFSTSYWEDSVGLVTFGAETDLKLFPAEPDEIRVYLSKVEEGATRQAREARTSADKKAVLLEIVQSTLAEADTLTAAATTQWQIAGSPAENEA